MNRITGLLILTLLFVGIKLSQAQNVYCINFKDGGTQILWTDMVDSMRVVKSHPEIAGNDYDVQEIFMNDTVYRFPLSSIERISFKRPKNVYKSDAIRLDENPLRSYIVSSSDQSFSVRRDIPMSIRPKIGDKVVAEECSDVFPHGFIGKIISIEENQGIVVFSCEDLYLHEVFDYYFGTTVTEAAPKPSKEVLRDNCANEDNDNFNPFDIQWDPTLPYSFNVAPYLPIKDLSVGATTGFLTHSIGFNIDKLRWDTELWPHLSIRTTIMVTPKDLLYGCVSVHGNVDVRNVVELRGAMFDERRLHNPQIPSFNIQAGDHNIKVDLKEVVKQPFFIPEFETGFFVRSNFEASLKTDVTTDYRLDGVFNFSMTGEPPLKNMFSLKPQYDRNSEDFEGLYLKGALDFGLYLTAKFNIRKFFVELGVDTGGRLEANVAIESNNDDKFYSTKRYETLSKSNVLLTPYTKVYWNPGVNVGDIFDYSISRDIWNKEGLPLFERIIVPVLGNIYAGRLKDNSSEILARVNISGHCILPWKIGFAAVDEAENPTYVYDNIPYRYLPDGGSVTLILKNLNPLKAYKVYPVIKYDDIEIFAPGIEIDVKTKVETVSAAVKENTATLSGKAYGDLMSSSVRVGFYYGKSDASLKKVYANISDDGTFYCELKSLEYSTNYMYKSFIEADTECMYGYTQYFKTEKNKSEEKPEVKTLTPEVKGKRVILKAQTNLDKDIVRAAFFRIYTAGDDRQSIPDILCNITDDGMLYSDEIALPYYNCHYYYQTIIDDTRYHIIESEKIYFKTDQCADAKIIDTAPRGARIEVTDLFQVPLGWEIFYRKKGESKWQRGDYEHVDRVRELNKTTWDVQFYDLESSTTYEFQINQGLENEVIQMLGGTTFSFTTLEEPAFDFKIHKGDKCAYIKSTAEFPWHCYYSSLYADSLLTKRVENYHYKPGCNYQYWNLDPDTDYYSEVEYYYGGNGGRYNRVAHKIHFKTYAKTTILNAYNVRSHWDMDFIKIEGLDDKLKEWDIRDYLSTRKENIGYRFGFTTFGIVYDYDNTDMMVTKDLISRGAYHHGEDYSEFPKNTRIYYRAYYIPYPPDDILEDRVNFEDVLSSVVYGPTGSFKVNYDD